MGRLAAGDCSRLKTREKRKKKLVKMV